mgnify:CR=1 FL=1
MNYNVLIMAYLCRTYLSIILGQVNVSLLNKSDRLNYKQNYENFKLVLNVITFFLSIALLIFPLRYRLVTLIYYQNLFDDDDMI